MFSDSDSHFELLTLKKQNEECGHRSLLFRTRSAEQSLTARKLGAVSTSGRKVEINQDPCVEDLFRFILVNKPSIVFLSALTGGFLTRGKQNSMDSNGLNWEPFEMHVTKNHNYAFFLRKFNNVGI